MTHLRFYLLFPLFLIALALSAQDQSSPILAPTGPAPNEVMPRFRADCPTGEEGKACADRAMLEYVYSRIQYPGKARRNGVEGTAVVTFIIERDGTVSNVQVLRDPGAGIGQEVKRIVETMNDNGPSWHAGIQDGKAVRVQFHLPVQFSLDTEKKGR